MACKRSGSFLFGGKKQILQQNGMLGRVGQVGPTVRRKSESEKEDLFFGVQLLPRWLLVEVGFRFLENLEKVGLGEIGLA